ncbi:MAG: hypothetical protein GY771_11130 [bacterium]|nr:hypothetical protein [bacterium]
MSLNKEVKELLDIFLVTKNPVSVDEALVIAENENSRADIYFVKGLKNYIIEGDPEKAEQDFRAVLHIIPTHVGAQSYLCLALLGQHTNKKAEEVIKTANRYLTGVLKDDGRLYNYKSVAHFRLGQYDAAISTARQAVIDDNTNHLPYINYLLPQFRLRNYDSIFLFIRDYLLREFGLSRESIEVLHTSIGEILPMIANQNEENRKTEDTNKDMEFIKNVCTLYGAIDEQYDNDLWQMLILHSLEINDTDIALSAFEMIREYVVHEDYSLNLEKTIVGFKNA